MDLSSIFIGGSHWVNLVNSIYLSNGERKDVFMNPESAKDWLDFSGLLDESEVIEDISLLIQRLMELRKICIRIITDLETHKTVTESVVYDLNNISASLMLFPSLILSETTLSHVLKGHNSYDGVLYRIIASITETFNTISLDRIRKCEHEECILYFVDTSKGGKRRWCSMETCGNRKKVSTFYYRKRKNEN